MRLHPRVLSTLTFVGVVTTLFMLGGRGLGYRTLWQDEIETAERAKSILDGGVPRVIDPNGNWSLNTGGREIDEGELHRYTPWAQFYLGAAGLAVGEPLGLTPDASVRLPFFTLHAVTSGLAAVFLPEVTGLSRLAAATIGVLYGVGSIRLIHDRTARYHSLTDFLFFVAWILYGIIRRRLRRDGARARIGFPLAGLVLAVSLLLHAHTLFGLLATGFFPALLILEFPKDRRSYFFTLALLPALIALIILVRPEEQSKVWGGLGYHPAHSLKNWWEIAYPIPFYVFSVLMAVALRGAKGETQRGIYRELRIAAAVPVLIILGIRLLDFHPFSQTRYYLPILGIFLFWPLAVGFESMWKTPRARWFYFASFIFIFFIAEFTSDCAPFQGLRIAFFDASSTEVQPLRLAFERLRELAKSGDAVLVEYVPQFVNWYAPDLKPALVPDSVAMAPISWRNPLITKIPFLPPDWHIYNVGIFEGYWVCAGGCDFTIRHDTGDSKSYHIHSNRLNRDFKFCIIDTWATNHWNNAPYMNYRPEGLLSTGAPWQTLALAKRCD